MDRDPAMRIDPRMSRISEPQPMRRRIGLESCGAFAICLGLLLVAPKSDAQETTPGDTSAEDPAPTDAAGASEVSDGSDPATADAPEEPVQEEPAPQDAGWEEEEPPAFVPRTIDPVLLAMGRQRGATVYRSYCSSCHGARGDGLGPAARFLSVAPRNLTTGVYKWRTTASGELPTDGDLLRTVRQGAPGTPMPAWEGRLSMRDMWSVVQYIKTFSRRFAEEGSSAPLPMPGRVPTLDDAARRRGRLVYVLLQCWTCHGMDGTGNGPAAASLLDDNGNSILAYDFTQNTVRAGNRPIDMYRTFTTGVNGTPMPSYDEAIIVGRDGYTDLANFEPVLSAEGLGELQRFIAAMPLTEELWALPEAERQAWGIGVRWDLTAYVRSLSSGDSFWQYLWSRSHAN